MGRWIDFENDYKTLYPWFMESVWYVHWVTGSKAILLTLIGSYKLWVGYLNDVLLYAAVYQIFGPPDLFHSGSL